LIQVSSQLEVEQAQKDPLRSGLCGDRAHLGHAHLYGAVATVLDLMVRVLV
jgi:hypothetical protein